MLVQLYWHNCEKPVNKLPVNKSKKIKAFLLWITTYNTNSMRTKVPKMLQTWNEPTSGYMAVTLSVYTMSEMLLELKMMAQ